MSTKMLPEDLRLAMIEELRADLNVSDVPDYAISFEEMVAALGVGRDKMRRSLNLLLASGEWKKGRVGLGVKYWRVE